MTTTFDQTDILYNLLTAPSNALKQTITGDVYKDVRPGQTLEDVVVNALPMGADQLQPGVANVNIYVPDVAAGLTFKTQNRKRLRQLAQLALQVLEQGDGAGYTFDLEYQDVMDEPETASHYVNLRIRFTHFNI